MALFEWLIMIIQLLFSCLNALTTANGGAKDPYATIAEDGNIVVTNSQSLCAHAFVPMSSKQPTINQPSFFNFTARSNSPLSIVNVGAGTTGKRNYNWFKFFDQCIETRSKEAGCRSSHALAAIEENLLWAVDNMNTLSDYPWSNFLPEILALVPDVKVLQTLRDPVEWAKRRLQHHNPKICHVDLHGSPLIRHPFDVIGCLAQTTYIYEAILNGQALMDTLKGDVTKARSLFADAFQQMNSFHMHITSTKKRQLTKTPLLSEKSNSISPLFSGTSSSLINLCLFDVRDRRQGAIDLVALLDPMAASARCIHMTYEKGGCPYFNLTTMARFDRAVCIKPSRDGIKRFKIKVPASICNNKTRVQGH